MRGTVALRCRTIWKYVGLKRTFDKYEYNAKCSKDIRSRAVYKKGGGRGGGGASSFFIHMGGWLCSWKSISTIYISLFWHSNEK
jgi:hypothetical protein